MENQVGRSRPAEWNKQDDSLSYRLKHLTPGQQKFAHIKAQRFLEEVMMDSAAPGFLKDLIRSQNAIGMMGLQLLLAGHVENELKDMAG
jgi:hypothetical protein